MLSLESSLWSAHGRWYHHSRHQTHHLNPSHTHTEPPQSELESSRILRGETDKHSKAVDDQGRGSKFGSLKL